MKIYCRYFYNFLFFLFLIGVSCKQSPSNEPAKDADLFENHNPQAISLLGKELNSPTPSTTLTERWEKRKNDFDKDPNNADNIIWHGRFTAYMGNYNEAIEIYSEGISTHPDDPRLYRHRGHRYITIRKFNDAISDFKKAESLIQGVENEVEPDGMPNAQNIPVSTLHGNIYYHLGLAYYLIDDLPNSLRAYKACLNTSENPDNVVSATHWIYSILTKMRNAEEAIKSLQTISADMELIENHSYFALCQFYKGALTEDELMKSDQSASASDAIKYGLANWHMYNGNREEGLQMLKAMSNQKSWASFGVIAAEADLSRL